MPWDYPEVETNNDQGPNINNDQDEPIVSDHEIEDEVEEQEVEQPSPVNNVQQGVANQRPTRPIIRLKRLDGY